MLAATAMDDLVQQKATLRVRMIAKRAALSEETAAWAKDQACGHLVDLVRERSARRVALFAGFKGELDPRGAEPALRALGARIWFPRVGGKRTLTFHEVVAGAELSPSSKGIPEPDASWPACAPGELDLVVAPGLAFDRAGGRLGWGGGYYDAALAKSETTAVGFCYAFQLVDSVPQASTDQRVDFIVCEDGPLQARP